MVEALKIIRSGGEDGLLLDEFAAQWPSQLPKGVKRKTNASVAQLLGLLVNDGLLDRSALGRWGRFTLTRKGGEFLDERATR